KSFFLQRDWRRISMNNADRTVAFKSDGMRLDIKRFSPGFMVDLALDSIEKAGFANAMVRVGGAQRNIGRDIFTPWSIQIGLGGKSDKLAHRALNYSISNVASATVTADGLGRGLIDPHSKRPVSNNLAQSTTVIAASAATATAYALAAYTLGPRIGLRFVEAHPEVKIIIVDTDGNLLASAGLGVSSPTALIDSQRTAPYDGGSNDLRQKQIEEERDQ
ncbi:MAG: FAD:protein FMN transferase, partial [Pseudomonadota bacterium]